MQATQAIWQTGEAQWPKTGSFDRIKANKWLFKKVATVAAGILLLFGVGLIWRLLTESSEPRRMIGKEPTAAEIEVAANRAAFAAQMLAVADLLSSQPGGEQYAVKRYNDVISSFPETEQRIEAELHLQRLIERRAK